MRRPIFYAGIAFSLIGLVFLVFSGYLQNFNRILVNKTSNSFEISMNLEEKSTYILDIRSSEVWRDDYTAGAYDTPQPLEMVITSPSGNETKLLAFFYARLPSSQYYTSTFPSLIEVEYMEVDSQNLEVDEYYPQIRFTVKHGGNYQAHIIEQTLNWTRGPPKEIQLYKEVIENQKSQAFFLQSGSILSLAGLATCVYGARAATKLRIRKRRNSK